jgi:hypothetical protein
VVGFDRSSVSCSFTAAPLVASSTSGVLPAFAPVGNSAILQDRGTVFHPQTGDKSLEKPALHDNGTLPSRRLSFQNLEVKALAKNYWVSTRTSVNFRKSRSNEATDMFSAAAVAAIRQSTKWTVVFP